MQAISCLIIFGCLLGVVESSPCQSTTTASNTSYVFAGCSGLSLTLAGTGASVTVSSSTITSIVQSGILRDTLLSIASSTLQSAAALGSCSNVTIFISSSTSLNNLLNIAAGSTVSGLSLAATGVTATGGIFYTTGASLANVVISIASSSVSAPVGSILYIVAAPSNVSFIAINSTLGSSLGFNFPGTGAVSNIQISLQNSPLTATNTAFSIPTPSSMTNVVFSAVNSTITAALYGFYLLSGQVSNFSFGMTNSAFISPFVFYITTTGSSSNVGISFTNSPVSAVYSLYYAPSSASVTNMTLALTNSSVRVSGGGYYGVCISGSATNFQLLIDRSNFTTSAAVMFAVLFGTLHTNVSVIVSSGWLTSPLWVVFQIWTPGSTTGFLMSLTDVVVGAPRLLDISLVGRYLNNTVLSMVRSTVTCSDLLSCAWQTAGVGPVVMDSTLFYMSDSSMTQGFDFALNVLTNFVLNMLRSNITSTTGGYGLYMYTTSVVYNVTAAYTNCTLAMNSFAHLGIPVTTSSVAIFVAGTTGRLNNVAAVNTGSVTNYNFTAINSTLSTTLGFYLAGSGALANAQLVLDHSFLTFTTASDLFSIPSLATVTNLTMSLMSSSMTGGNSFASVTLASVVNFYVVVTNSTISSAWGFYFSGIGSMINGQFIFVNSPVTITSVYSDVFRTVSFASVTNIAIVLLSSPFTGMNTLSQINVATITNYSLVATNSPISSQWGLYNSGATAVTNLQLIFINSPVTLVYSLYNGAYSLAVTNMTVALLNGSSVSSGASWGAGTVGIYVAGSLTNVVLLILSNVSIPSSTIFRSIYGTLHTNVTIVAAGVSIIAQYNIAVFDSGTSMTGLVFQLTNLHFAGQRLLDIVTWSRFLNNTVIFISSSLISGSDTVRCIYMTGISSVMSNMLITVTDTAMTQGFDFEAWNTITNVTLLSQRSSITTSGTNWLTLVSSSRISGIRVTLDSMTQPVVQSLAAPSIDTWSMAVGNSNITMTGSSDLWSMSTISPQAFSLSIVNSTVTTGGSLLRLVQCPSVSGLSVLIYESIVTSAAAVVVVQSSGSVSGFVVTVNMSTIATHASAIALTSTGAITGGSITFNSTKVLAGASALLVNGPPTSLALQFSANALSFYLQASTSPLSPILNLSAVPSNTTLVISTLNSLYAPTGPSLGTLLTALPSSALVTVYAFCNEWNGATMMLARNVMTNQTGRAITMAKKRLDASGTSYVFCRYQSRTSSRSHSEAISSTLWLKMVQMWFIPLANADYPTCSNACIGAQGKLATIGSASLNSLAAKYIVGGADVRAMLGGNRIGDTVFRWKTGYRAHEGNGQGQAFFNAPNTTGTCLTYCNWAPGQPENAGGTQDAVVMYMNGSWADDNTADGCLCEKYKTTPTRSARLSPSRRSMTPSASRTATNDLTLSSSATQSTSTSAPTTISPSISVTPNPRRRLTHSKSRLSMTPSATRPSFTYTSATASGRRLSSSESGTLSAHSPSTTWTTLSLSVSGKSQSASTTRPPSESCSDATASRSLTSKSVSTSRSNPSDSDSVATTSPHVSLSMGMPRSKSFSEERGTSSRSRSRSIHISKSENFGSGTKSWTWTRTKKSSSMTPSIATPTVTHTSLNSLSWTTIGRTITILDVTLSSSSIVSSSMRISASLTRRTVVTKTNSLSNGTRTSSGSSSARTPIPSETETLTVQMTKYVAPVLSFKRSIVVRSLADRGAVTLQVLRDPLRDSMLVHYQQAFTGAPFDFADLGDARCDYVRIDTTVCMALNDCVPSPGQSYFVGTNGTALATYTNLAITMGPATLANPSCPASSVIAAAVIEGDMPFVTVPIYRFASLSSSATAAATIPNAATMNITIVEPTNAVVVPKQLSLFIPPSSTSTSLVFNETEIPRLSRAGDFGGTVHCSIPDVSSFERTELGISVDLGLLYSSDCTYAVTAASGADLQALCLADDLCVALTTTATGSPLCLLRSGRGIDPFGGLNGRWLMTKATPQERTCSAVATSSGTLTVLLRQTSLASSSSVVFVGSAVVAQCGRLKVFAGGLFGQSSACGMWMVCYIGPVRVNDTVSVVASAATTAGGCDGSVGVLFDMIFDAVDQTQPPEPRIPASLSPSSLRQSFPHRLYINNARRSFVNVFAYNVEQLVLDVAQTGYDCNKTLLGHCTRPAVELVIGSQVLQQCGGSLPFLLNVSGVSDQCSQPRFCGFPLAVGSSRTSSSPAATSGSSGDELQPAASSQFGDGFSAASGVIESAPAGGFFGWVQLRVDITTIRFASSLCQYFGAVLSASTTAPPRNSSSPSNISGFVLHSGRGAFSVLVASRLGTAIANFTAALTGTVALPMIGALLGADDARDVRLVNMTSYFAAVEHWGGEGGANTSFACVMDWISGASGSCVVPVPRGANFVTVRVAQTNFAPLANIMTVAQLDDSASIVAGAVSCGGANGFAGLPSLSEHCTAFLPCGGGFLEPSAALVRLSVPAAVGNSATCTVAFAATVDFQFLNRTIPGSCPFLCVGDRTCVPQSSVCNGVVDCSDGSDEVSCNTWTKIESENIFTLTADTQVASTQAFGDCRGAALRKGTNLFAVSRNQSVCILYPAPKAAGYLADPTPYIIPTPNFVMFAMLPNGASYGRCTSENSCSGNGKVVESRTGGKLACTCVCSTGFTRSDCSTRMVLGTQGPIIVSFSADAEVPTPSQIEAALGELSNSTDTSVSCSPPVSENGKLLATCTVTGTASEISSINAAVTTEAARLKVALALKINVTSFDPMTPSTQPLFQAASCAEISGAVACTVGGQAIRSIRASVTASSGVGEIVLNLGLTQTQPQQIRQFDVAAAPSSSSLRCVPNNKLYETPTRTGCTTTVCFVSIGAPAPVDTIAVSMPSYAGNASSDPCYSVGLEFTVSLLVTDVVRVFPAKASDDFSPFLISGVVTLVVGGLLLGAASAALRLHISESSKAVGDVETTNKLKSILTTAIRKMRFNQRRNVRAERWSTAFAVASFDLLVLGIFLALYFLNSSGYNSNVEVLLENYRTSECDQSTFASLASRVTIVPATSSQSCMLRESTGTAGGAIYAAAYCDNSTGNLTIQVKIGSSLSECNAMTFTPYAAGAYIRTVQLLSHLNDSSYMLFQCGTTRSVETRFAAFLALNADTPDVDVTRPQPPPSSVAQPSNRLVSEASSIDSRSLFVSTRVSLASASNVTSTVWNRFESSGRSGLVAGDSVSQRLVVQLAVEVFDANTLGIATAAVENVYPLKAIGGDVAVLGPLDDDYPTGFLFNNFNLPGEAPLYEAGPGAARYYGVRGTAADIGQFYQGGARSGFTITMYLRCTRSTAGFAFAVADAREDMVKTMSPLLIRLMAMLANGSPGTAWYNSTYSVYSGLYVDGPGAALRFVYANPSPGSPDSALVDLQWDMTGLGLLRLFNGVWHHVAIILRSENENTKVQLVVDGVTSTSQNGWNLCPRRIPEPVQLLSPEIDVSVRNFQAERVLTDGVLFTGYFNGGVAHLEFVNEKIELFDLWRSSTSAIQTHNAIKPTEYIALGSLLLAIGVLMLGAMIATSGGEWLHAKEVSEERELHHAHEEYDGLWQKTPKDPQGIPYMPLPWNVAIGCMSCDVKTFAVFLDELRFNFRHQPKELVRLLYAKSIADTGPVNPNMAPPTAEEWRLHFSAQLVVDSSSIRLKDGNEETVFQRQPEDAVVMNGAWNIVTVVLDPKSTNDNGCRFDTGSVKPKMDPTTVEEWSFLAEPNEKGDQGELDCEVFDGVATARDRKEITTTPKTSLGLKTESTVTQCISANHIAIVCEPLQALPPRAEKVEEEKKEVKVEVDKEEVKIDKSSIPANKNLDHGNDSSSGAATKGDSGNRISAKGGGGDSANSPSPSELVQTVLGVIQSVSVWQSSLPFPVAHLATFQAAFATFSLDLTVLVNSSPLVTPLVQLFVGLVVFGVLLFVVESDEKAFLWNLARYVVVRDSHDLGVPQEEVRNRVDGDYMSEVTSDFDSLLGEVPDNGLLFTVPLLPLHQAQKIDDFVSGNQRRALATARAIMICDNHQRNITLQKPPGARDNCPIAYLYVRCPDAETTPLRELGHCCALHASRVLGPQVQTNVWPYKYRPSCCVETHGHRCGESVGKMYVCGEREEKEDNELVQCKYAVCEKHFRAPLSVKLLTPLIGMYRAAMDRGVLWFVVTVFLVLANACYTPFMKTALMILACDPTYQCQFQHCWEGPDRLFILAAYLCLVIVTFYGVGFPLSMAVLLRRRRQMLNEIFFSDVYKGRFEDDSAGPGHVTLLNGAAS